MKLTQGLISFALTAFFVLGCASNQGPVKLKTVIKEMEREDGIYARIQTSKGNIILKLDHTNSPLEAAQFIGLAEGELPNRAVPEGTGFYDSTRIHKIMPHMSVSGGSREPYSTEDPLWSFSNDRKGRSHDTAGLLTIPRVKDSLYNPTFAITLVKSTWLDAHNAVIGQVIQGMDVVESISQVAVTKDYSPFQPVHIWKVEIYRQGKMAKNFDARSTFEAKL